MIKKWFLLRLLFFVLSVPFLLFFCKFVDITLLLYILIFLLLFFDFKNIKNISKKINESVKKIKLISKKQKINPKNELNALESGVNEIVLSVRESEQERNDFISTISHEIRTPITSIKGWAETICVDENIDFSLIRRGLKIIISESDRLSGIAKELSDFANLSSGKMRMRFEKIDIVAEFIDLQFIFSERATNEGKVFNFSFDEDISPICGDGNKLKQVFVNIIDNSFKYSNKNCIISVKIFEKNKKVSVEITDNGIGIPKRELGKIKQKFYKVNPESVGSGIGLAVVSEIISMHGGDLQIMSEEGIGTSVIFSFDAFEGEKN